jgi:hypothetical protein
VQADKNSQNLIPTYQQMALDKLKSQRDSLAQREQQEYNNWLANENLNMQNYARQLTQQNTDRQLKLQEDQLMFQKDQYNDSKNATPSMDLSALAQLAKIDADNDTNYVELLFGITPTKTNNNTTGYDSTSMSKTSDHPNYTGYTIADFSDYLGQVRESKGAAAANEELNRLIKEGAIRKDWATLLAMSARGSFGH